MVNCYKWISVKDRLPITEEDIGDRNYLDVEVICFDGRSVSAIVFEAGNTVHFWCGFHNDYGKVVTHWMPLPEPPD